MLQGRHWHNKQQLQELEKGLMKLSMINWDLKTLIGRSTNFTSLINFVVAQDQGCLTTD